ncbi:acyl-CoA dehydrogenase family protein [Nocardioides sp. KIGAM211]|uniref:Acyl-CoA dehydrogenase family protein n=1 Tax=Nocardioides luti TaxID=2761101 RepID=A0A7X0RF63_9ACTN|nr:acyl-CoA dehydrogenase family protein [Nocardioides luti]MBB6627092.1 acyl-CoA dehydrogenase family protein [Nocardioides luti]
MTLDQSTRPRTLLADLRATYAPLLEEIAAGTVQRELDGELPTEQVRRLKEAGFGAVRVPVEHGGRGADLVELTQLWINLATADANLPQALRGHFALAEDRLFQHVLGDDQRAWFARFAAGEIAGNAWSEVGSTGIDTQQTVLTRDGDGYRINGEKYYTTGSIFAEWADVYTRRPGGATGRGEDDYVIAVVDTRERGVTVTDDWDGFGQRGTGSGTTAFDDVWVNAENVLVFSRRFPYQTAFYQLNLLATLTGIGRAALRDAVAAVRRRERNYSHANAPRVRDDAQVLARIGEIAAAVYAAEATTLRVAAALEATFRAGRGPDATLRALNEAAEIESSAAQVVVTDLVLRATSDLFDTLGASATSRAHALDRHWRNARTVSSHNPRILKARVVGGYEVNGTPPPYAWAIGATERGQAWSSSADEAASSA